MNVEIIKFQMVLFIDIHEDVTNKFKRYLHQEKISKNIVSDMQ